MSTSYPVPDSNFDGLVRMHAKIIDLIHDTVVAETDLVLEGEDASVLDQVGNMMVTVPLGDPGTEHSLTPFATALMNAAGGAGAGANANTLPYLLGLSFDGGLSYDSYRLIQKPVRNVDATKMTITESGNDIWETYANIPIRRMSMDNVVLGDALNGQFGTIVAQPFVTPIGYNEGAGIISDSDIIPGAQGLFQFRPIPARKWVGKGRLYFTPVLDDGSTTPIDGSGPSVDLSTLTISVDTNHDSVAKAFETVLKSLAGTEGNAYRGHYTADPSDAALNITGIDRGLAIGTLVDSGLTFVSSGETTYVDVPDDIDNDLTIARITGALNVSPDLSDRYWSATIRGGQSNADIPQGMQITGVACLPPNLPLFSGYVNDAIGGIYTTIGDSRVRRVSPQFGCHDMQVRHPTQVVYAATAAGVYSGSTITSALLNGQDWSRVGGLLGSVQKLQLIGHFTAQWTTIDIAPSITRPTIPTHPATTYEATYAFYPGDTSQFFNQVKNDPRFSPNAGNWPSEHPDEYAKALLAGASFYTGLLPTPAQPNDVTSPPLQKPPISPAISPVSQTAFDKAVVNAVFALVNGTGGGDGLYMYPGVQDQTIHGEYVLGDELNYNATGQLVGIDYTDALSQLSAHEGWDKVINGTVSDFGVMFDGTIIWIEQQGSNQILRTNGLTTDILFMPAGVGVSKIVTSPQVAGAWIIPTGGLQALYFLAPGMNVDLVPLDTDTSLNQPQGIPVTISSVTSIRDIINGQYVDNIVCASNGFYWNSQSSGGGWRLGTGQGGLDQVNLLFLVTGSKFTMTDHPDMTIYPMFATDGNLFYISNNGGVNWRALGQEPLDLGPFFFDQYIALHGKYPPFNPFTRYELAIPATSTTKQNPGSYYQFVRRLDNHFQFVYNLEDTLSAGIYEYTQVVSNLGTSAGVVNATLASEQLALVHTRWLPEHQKPIILLNFKSAFTKVNHKLRTLRAQMIAYVTYKGFIPNDKGSVTYVNYINKPFYVLAHSKRGGGTTSGAVTTTTLSSEMQKNRRTPDMLVADLVQLSKDFILRNGK